VTRLVIDASAFLSGIVGTDPSPPARLVDALFDGHFESVVCPRLLGEVRRGLTQPYFLKRIDPFDAERAVREIARASIQLRDPREPASVVRDPNDDYLVALALAANARAIVTGDRDLLDHPGLNPPALTVRAACELLEL
jgi:putative PIN family toxin of toxin-antitoxin system